MSQGAANLTTTVNIIFEVIWELLPKRSNLANLTKDTLVGAMIGGARSKFRIGCHKLNEMIASAIPGRNQPTFMNSKMHGVRSDLRAGVIDEGAHGFDRKRYPSGWSTHPEWVRDLCDAFWDNNPDEAVFELDQEGCKVKRKNEPAMVFFNFNCFVKFKSP